MRACEEAQQPNEVDERWVSLLLAASLYWLRRRLINGGIFIRQAKITPGFWKKKMIGVLQLECEHKETYRSGNQYGSYLHCRVCGMRLQYFTVEDRSRAMARKERSTYRRKSGVSSWLEWDHQRPKKATEQELNTEGKYPVRTSSTGVTRGSTS